MALEHSCLDSAERTFSTEGKKWLMKDLREETTCGRFLAGLIFSRPWFRYYQPIRKHRRHRTHSVKHTCTMVTTLEIP
jgi:hypothetical protein